jgi:glucose-6-phosphate-specific signal transduction histidine kinase
MSTHDVVARTAERIQKWFRRPGGGASMQLHNVVEPIQAESPNKPSVGVQRTQPIFDEGRLDLQGPRPNGSAPDTLEEALSGLRDELTSGVRLFRIYVTGKSKALKPIIREQLYLIGREALVNALRHSKATNIEAEIVYLPGRLRMVVRDNGRGIDSQFVRADRDDRQGLLGMRERAGSIGARFRILSKPGCGTEVEIQVPGDITESYD